MLNKNIMITLMIIKTINKWINQLILIILKIFYDIITIDFIYFIWNNTQFNYLKILFFKKIYI